MLFIAANLAAPIWQRACRGRWTPAIPAILATLATPATVATPATPAIIAAGAIVATASCLAAASAPRLLAAPALQPAAAPASQASPAAPAAPIPRSAPPLQVAEIRVNVTDLDRALVFYSELGCEVVRRGPQEIELRNGKVPVVLHRVAGASRVDYPRDVETHINFQVKDLDEMVAALRRQRFEVLDAVPETAAIGKFTSVKDPAGNVIHLMQLSAPTPGLDRPVIFNIGIKVTDMALARKFYCQVLGFEVFSEDYYPPTVPLKRAGVIALTLHDNAKVVRQPGYPATAQTVVRLATDNLASARAELGRKGVSFLAAPQADGAAEVAAFADPFGNVLELVELSRH